MNTVEKMDFLIAAAEKLGYRVRYEYFGGTGGGACRIAGQKCLFIDLALSATEQLELLESWLNNDPLFHLGQSTKLNPAA